MTRMKTTSVCGLAAMLLAVAAPAPASAFCGFYVSGGNAELFADATMVVMMREGTTTVLSMRNDYRGPPENFAMVVPVPEVLDESRVKTLPSEIFDRVDQLASPRLVEYWEQDPCVRPSPGYGRGAAPSGARLGRMRSGGGGPAADLGVTVEAEFAVGEYEIVILSAEDSSGLDTWLRQEGYNIPPGAEPRLRPYVEGGSKFFVARVDVSKVTFGDEGIAQLSPLRVHYTSDTFQLPIRLGLVNSSDRPQDLIVHVLARNQRYEVANRPNVTIPTNIDVADSVRERFGPFYVALFDETLRVNPGAVVTEYAWQATNCDPCPGPVLSGNDLQTLGGDVVAPAGMGAVGVGGLGGPGGPGGRFGRMRRRPSWGMNFVLTRLHARYTADEVEDDLVFRAADPIVGGREFLNDANHLEEGARPSHANNFQGRYAIRHAWEGPIECENPVRGRWGGPPAGTPRPGTAAAQGLAYAARGAVRLPEVVRTPVPEIGLSQVGALAGASAADEAADDEDEAADDIPDPPNRDREPGCAGCSSAGGAAGALVPFVLLFATRRRSVR